MLMLLKHPVGFTPFPSDNNKAEKLTKNCSYYKSCDLFSSASSYGGVFCCDRYLAIYARSGRRNAFGTFL